MTMQLLAVSGWVFSILGWVSATKLNAQKRTLEEQADRSLRLVERMIKGIKAMKSYN